MAQRNEKVITITGAAEHNLKNISLSIPRDQLVVITGISGSGKSSLAFDTIYAEGRRKYVESLSAYARQFLEQMQKPAVGDISGLPPTIAIEQRSASSNPRSTVATTTASTNRLAPTQRSFFICHHMSRPLRHQNSKVIAVRSANSAQTLLAAKLGG